MLAAVKPSADKEIYQCNTCQANHFRPYLPQGSLKNADLFEGAYCMVRRHESGKGEIVGCKAEKCGAVYWHHCPGKEHKKEQGKVPRNQNLGNCLGNSRHNKAETYN